MINYKSGIIVSILMLSALAMSSLLAVPAFASNPLAATALPTAMMVTAQPLATAAATKPAVTPTATATKPVASPTATKTNAPTATRTATPLASSTSGPTATRTVTPASTVVTGTPGAEPTEILDPTETPTPTETPWPTDIVDSTAETPTPTMVGGPTPTPSYTPNAVPTHISLIWPRFYTPAPVPNRNSIALATAQSRRTSTTTARVVGSVAGARTATPQSVLSGLFPDSKPTLVALAPQDPTQPDQPLDEEAMMPPETLETSPEEANQADPADKVWQLAHLAVVGLSSILWIAGGILGTGAVFLFVRGILRG